MNFYLVSSILTLHYSIFLYFTTLDLDKAAACILCSMCMYQLGIISKLENDNISLKEELNGKD